jgi:peptide/nickel transport system substrate-binding protein
MQPGLIGVVLVVLTVGTVLGACAPAAPASTPGAGRQGDEARGIASAPLRTLAIAFHYEPSVLAPRSVESTGSFKESIRLFNAALALVDGAGRPHPYLTSALPTLHGPSWQVFPDGRMETTYPLRPGLTWHDGHPLTAEDFVFAWQVYATPGQGLFYTNLLDQIERVLAPDPQTVVIHWRTPYPDAAALQSSDLDPLPRHLLGSGYELFAQDAAAYRESFGNLAYWKSEYVGLGPYRLERWEPGTVIEGMAFAGHALGRPRIDRVLLRLIGDQNTVLTNLLAGEVQLAIRSIQFEQGVVLRQRWSADQGTVLFIPTGTNPTAVQFRPEFQQVPDLLDVRVRRALAHAIDREALNEGIFDGQGLMSDTYVTPQVPYYRELDRALRKYPHDLARSEQLMSEAGISKGRDGFFLNAAGQRLSIPYLVQAGTEYEKSGTILTDLWRRAGFDVQMAVLATAARGDASVRHSFSGLHHNAQGAGEKAALNFTMQQVGTAANRWGGVNRGGWSHGEYERLYDAFVSTLDRTERDQHMIQMMVLLSEVLPAFQTYLRFTMVAHTANLRGPAVIVPESMNVWDIHAWELR